MMVPLFGRNVKLQFVIPVISYAKVSLVRRASQKSLME